MCICSLYYGVVYRKIYLNRFYDFIFQIVSKAAGTGSGNIQQQGTSAQSVNADEEATSVPTGNGDVQLHAPTLQVSGPFSFTFILSTHKHIQRVLCVVFIVYNGPHYHYSYMNNLLTYDGGLKHGNGRMRHRKLVFQRMRQWGGSK